MEYFQKSVDLFKQYGLLTIIGVFTFVINVANYNFIDPIFPILASTVFVVYIFWTQDLKFDLFITILAVFILLFFNFLTLSIWFLLLGVFLLILRKVYLKTLAEAKREQNHYLVLANKSLQPITLYDKTGKILFASKSIDDLLGISGNLLIGKNLEDFMPEENKKTFQSFYKEIIKKPLEKNSIEVQLKQKNGSLIWVHSDVVNLLKDNNVRAILSSFQDITKQKELDRQRIGSLKREREARTVAEAAVKARDEFLSIASHELKTPLTTVLLQLQNTLRRILTQSLADFSGVDLVKSLKIAEQQSQRLSILIKDLLNVSLVSTGKLQLEKEEADLSKLVRSLVQRFEAEIKLSGSEIKLNAKNPLIISLDTVRIEQAISNILVNALKYGKRKPVEITVEKDKIWATVSIKDHGPGIHKKYQDVIFEPFERVNGNQVKGLGVGLFIAKQIARAHKGNIAISSTPGHGAEFLLKLPLKN